MAENSEPILNQIPNLEVSLKDLLDLWKKDIFLTMNCHAVAKISEFFPADQTATATLEYKQTFFRNNSDGTVTSRLVDYPVLVQCPVIVLGGGGGALTFPIAAGDECVVLFNDRDIDNWWTGNSGGPPASNRAHAFSDGFLLVGARSKPNVLENYDMDRAVLKYKNARVGVGKDNNLVLVANNSTTLFALINTLITAIKDLTTAANDLVTATAAITVTGVTPGGAPSGPPANIADILAVASSLATVTSDLTSVATNFEGLLE